MVEPISIGFSAAALALTMGTFAWQHLRKTDAIIGTVVAIEPGPIVNDGPANFHLSFANLGTRAALLRTVTVNAYVQPDFQGVFAPSSGVVSGELPCVLKAGEMCCLTIRAQLSVDFRCLAARAAQARGGMDTELFFGILANAWNPKGKRLVGEKHLAKLALKAAGTGWTLSSVEDHSFRFRKRRLK